MARTSSSVRSLRSASCVSWATTAVVSGFTRTSSVVSAFRRTSVSLEGDIDLTALFFNSHAFQADRFLRRVRSRFSRELVPVPRAHDAHLRFVKAIAGRDLFLVHHFAHRGNDQSLTDRAAHVRTGVVVRMQPAANTEDADRAIADVNDETAVFGTVSYTHLTLPTSDLV